MDIMYLLIPLSAGLVLVVIGVFGWALHRGQFDDLEREGERILLDDSSVIDHHQDSRQVDAEESRRVPTGS
jgi:cbb3-type cytochrome oxidase maturation protein